MLRLHSAVPVAFVKFLVTCGSHSVQVPQQCAWLFGLSVRLPVAFGWSCDACLQKSVDDIITARLAPRIQPASVYLSCHPGKCGLQRTLCAQVNMMKCLNNKSAGAGRRWWVWGGGYPKLPSETPRSFGQRGLWTQIVESPVSAVKPFWGFFYLKMSPFLCDIKPWVACNYGRNFTQGKLYSRWGH